MIMLASVGCHKSSGTDYTKNMGKTRKWTGTRIYQIAPRDPIDTVVMDTSFQLTIVTPTTVNFGGTTISYTATAASEGYYQFYASTTRNTLVSTFNLFYYYKQDSIVLQEQDVNIGNYQYIDLSTAK